MQIMPRYRLRQAQIRSSINFGSKVKAGNEIESDILFAIRDHPYYGRHAPRATNVHDGSKLRSAGSIHRIQVRQVHEKKKARHKAIGQRSHLIQTAARVLHPDVATVANRQDETGLVHVA